MKRLYVVTDGLPGPDSCKFVELEDWFGEGHGRLDSGIDWEDHPNGQNGLQRLGPFVALKEIEDLKPDLIAFIRHARSLPSNDYYWYDRGERLINRLAVE